MQHSWEKRFLAKWLITRFQTLWPRRVTMLWHLCQSTLSKPHQIQWVWIHSCCYSNSLLLSTDVLKYELCVSLPALFDAAGTMLQSDKPSQANAIQGWVQPSSIQIPQDISYIYDGGAQIHEIPLKTWQTYGSLCGKYTEYVKKICPTKVLFDGYPGGPSTEDNSHLRWKKLSSYLKEAT